MTTAGPPLRQVAAEPWRRFVAADRRTPLLGIVGGLGPLASAELVRTIYRCHVGEREQTAPGVVLYSDPSFPDRTQGLLSGGEDELAERLVAAIEALLRAGAERILVACFTIHHVLPRLPAQLRAAVISLLDLALDAVIADPRPRLLLSTAGTRACRVFEAHSRWGEAAVSLTSLDEADQRRLHRWIYRLKSQGRPRPLLDWLSRRADEYAVEGFLFGCTELHLLQPSLARSRRRWVPGVVDPLLVAARAAPAFLAGEAPPEVAAGVRAETC